MTATTGERPAADRAPAPDAAVQAALASLLAGRDPEQVQRLSQAAALAAQAGAAALQQGIAVASILAGLRPDVDLLCACLLYPAMQQAGATVEPGLAACGDDVCRLIADIGRLAALRLVVTPDAPQAAGQAETLRKLLLAMAADVRVVLVLLADRLHALRQAAVLDASVRRQLAQDTLALYAPLANRLGVWQLKWPLEDLALRYLEPDAYRDIARRLAERRADREAYVARVIALLRAEFERAGIAAELTGRSKHIYSIWRKIARKQIDFEQIADKHAVRVLVADVAACYAALGVVHTRWPYLRSEFDDYITHPKHNHYQSLHTAVIGPEGKVVEVQIRTRDMHEHAELGVAAHWRYKEGHGRGAGLEQKIAWLRRLLDPHESEGDSSDLLERFRTELFHDRVYVFTPQGRVLDLPQGATPIDFAYLVHTDLGHRCRGAKVNGRMLSLQHVLQHGDRVEILTGREGGPSRDWLNPALGFIKSPNARAKVRTWFRQQEHAQQLQTGRQLLERELRRHGAGETNLQALAQRLHFATTDALYAALARGEVSQPQLAAALTPVAAQSPSAAAAAASVLPVSAAELPTPATGPVQIAGVGALAAQLARCCHPLPGDAIGGYITRGRGVTVHRADCANLRQHAQAEPERLVAVSWNAAPEQHYTADVKIEAADRTGLLRDLTTLLANERVHILSAQTTTDRRRARARIALRLQVGGIEALTRVLAKLRQLPDVLVARRRGS